MEQINRLQTQQGVPILRELNERRSEKLRVQRRNVNNLRANSLAKTRAKELFADLRSYPHITRKRNQ